MPATLTSSHLPRALGPQSQRRRGATARTAQAPRDSAGAGAIPLPTGNRLTRAGSDFKRHKNIDPLLRNKSNQRRMPDLMIFQSENAEDYESNETLFVVCFGAPRSYPLVAHFLSCISSRLDRMVQPCSKESGGHFSQAYLVLIAPFLILHLS